MSKAFDFIRERTSKPELLAQLAEESAELAQAALKYRRVLSGDSPTPMKEEDALARLAEEIADVQVCAALVTTPKIEQQISNIKHFKALRWTMRLKMRESEIPDDG